MKLPTLLLIACLAISPLVAAGDGSTSITREEAQKIPTMDLEKIEDKAHTIGGQLVRLKFNSRGTDVEKKGSKIEATLYFYRSSSSPGGFKSAYLSVNVPLEGESWLMNVSTKDSRSSLLIYAKLSSDGRSATLLGKEIKTELTGPKIVW